MAQDKTQSSKPETKSDLQTAAALVLENDRRRKQRAQARSRKLRRKRAREQHAALHRMLQSIEIIKWCIVGIAAVMFLGIVLAIWTLSEVGKEVEKVQTYVAEIEREVDQVRESLRNPMESVGAMFGRQLDDKLDSIIGNRLRPQDPEQE